MAAIAAEGPDYALSLPALLRGATKSVHDDTVGMESVGWLTRGELSREEYARYLMMRTYAARWKPRSRSTLRTLC